MKKYLSSVVAAALLSSFVVGCSDSNDDDNNEVATTYKTSFAASAGGETSGVSYTCGTEKGDIVAGTAGLFGPCKFDEVVIFNLGNVELGQYKVTKDRDLKIAIKSTDLVEDASAMTRALTAEDLAVKNTSLLNSMDNNGNPDDGIKVEKAAVDALNKQFPTPGQKLAAVEPAELDRSVEAAVKEAKTALPEMEAQTTEESIVKAEALSEEKIPASDEAGAIEEPNVTGAAS